jgi:hypothetical protein
VRNYSFKRTAVGQLRCKLTGIAAAAVELKRQALREMFRKITGRDKPESIRRQAAMHEVHLREALAIALRRAGRSKPLVRELLSNATIEGLASRLKVKAAVVSFMVPRYKQSWHEIIPWQYLASDSPSETARSIAWSVRANIRRCERKRESSGSVA